MRAKFLQLLAIAGPVVFIGCQAEPLPVNIGVEHPSPGGAGGDEEAEAERGGSGANNANGGDTATEGQGNATGGKASSAAQNNSSSGGKTSRSGKGSGGSLGNATASGTGKSLGGTSSMISKASSGGAGNSGGKTIKKFVGNITARNAVPSDFAKYWDQITPENEGKWGSVQTSASGSFNWSSLDAIHDFAKKNNIIFKQHTFVWKTQQPSGVNSLSQIQNWMKALCDRYPDVALIDVVNEATHVEPPYKSVLQSGMTGTYGWVVKAHKLAREACPNAKLVLNDYNNIEWDADMSKFIALAKEVKAGGPIDAVGCQSHDAYRKTKAELQANLDKLHTQIGLPIYITEYDVSDTNDTSQANKYKEQFPVFWETDYIEGITIWGHTYGTTWSQAPNSGLVKNGQPREALKWLMQYLGK